MSDILVPADLSGVDVPALREFQSQIQAQAELLSEDVAGNADALEQLALDAERIATELNDRAETAEGDTDRGQLALSKILGSKTEEAPEELAVEDEPEPEPEPAPEPEVVEETVVEEPVEAATDDGADTATAEPPAAATKEAAVSKKAAKTSFAVLRNARPEGADPGEAGEGTQAFAEMRGATDLLDRKDQRIDRAELAEIICHKSGQMSKMGVAPFDPITLATHRVEFPDNMMLSSGERENFAVIGNLTKQAESLVASGGNCAPLSPSYDYFRLAEIQNPVENTLPTVGAPRGGIRIIVPPAYRDDVTDGVRITTEAQDAAGYTTLDPAGPTEPKPCTRVTCPDTRDCQVDVISKCVTFGNLNYRVFPEQVEDFLARLDVYFAETKEIFYLDKIVAGSTAVNITPPYGATRGLTYAMGLAAHGYRKRNHMDIDAPLDVIVPDSLINFIKTDMVNDHSMGLGFLNVDAATVAREMFTQFNLNVSWRYDNTTAEGFSKMLKQAQAPGALNGYPTTFGIQMFAPGTWARLDLGILDLGIVRDSTLNSTNDLQLWMEQWIQVCMIGLESLNLTVTLCPDGGGPEAHDLLVCNS